MRLALAGGTGADTLQQPGILGVRVEPPVSSPDDLVEWLQRQLEADAPAGCTIRVVDRQTGLSAAGWPMDLVRAVAVDGDGRVVEGRLVALYRLFDDVAAAMVRLSPSRTPAAESAALRALESPRVQLGDGEITSLVELWQPHSAV